MVSGNMFQYKKSSWPPQDYVNRATLELVSLLCELYNLVVNCLTSFLEICYELCDKAVLLFISCQFLECNDIQINVVAILVDFEYGVWFSLVLCYESCNLTMIFLSLLVL